MFCRKVLFVHWFVVVACFSPAVWALWSTSYGDFATSPYNVFEQGGAEKQFQMTFPDVGVITITGLSGSSESQTLNGVAGTGVYTNMRSQFAVTPSPQIMLTNLVLGTFVGIIGFHLNSSGNSISMSLGQRVGDLWFVSLQKIANGFSVLIIDGLGGTSFTINIVAVERYDSGGEKTIKVTVTYKQNDRTVTLTYLVNIPSGELEPAPLHQDYDPTDNPDDREPSDSDQGSSEGCLSGCAGVIGAMISCCFGSQRSGQGNVERSKGSEPVCNGLKRQLSNQSINPESPERFIPIQLDVECAVIKHAVDAGYFLTSPSKKSVY